MNVQHLKREPADHKPATDTFSVDGVVVEANAHRGIVCYEHGTQCAHVRAVADALESGQVPALEEWDRTKHWG